MFEPSYLSANGTTHYMLTLSKTYAVKTGRPRFVEWQSYGLILQSLIKIFSGGNIAWFHLPILEKLWECQYLSLLRLLVLLCLPL